MPVDRVGRVVGVLVALAVVELPSSGASARCAGAAARARPRRAWRVGGSLAVGRVDGVALRGRGQVERGLRQGRVGLGQAERSAPPAGRRRRRRAPGGRRCPRPRRRSARGAGPRTSGPRRPPASAPASRRLRPGRCCAATCGAPRSGCSAPRRPCRSAASGAPRAAPGARVSNARGRRSGDDARGEFEQVQRAARVAVGVDGDGSQHAVFDLQVATAQSALVVVPAPCRGSRSRPPS